MSVVGEHSNGVEARLEGLIEWLDKNAGMSNRKLDCSHHLIDVD
ncbi:hypothetical protein [Niallia endozanthoxylica]|nr:hypothetical protein [Niallia endozanthoxylica]